MRRWIMLVVVALSTASLHAAAVEFSTIPPQQKISINDECPSACNCILDENDSSMMNVLCSMSSDIIAELIPPQDIPPEDAVETFAISDAREQLGTETQAENASVEENESRPNELSSKANLLATTSPGQNDASSIVLDNDIEPFKAEEDSLQGMNSETGDVKSSNIADDKTYIGSENNTNDATDQVRDEKQVITEIPEQKHDENREIAEELHGDDDSKIVPKKGIPASNEMMGDAPDYESTESGDNLYSQHREEEEDPEDAVDETVEENTEEEEQEAEINRLAAITEAQPPTTLKQEEINSIDQSVTKPNNMDPQPSIIPEVEGEENYAESVEIEDDSLEGGNNENVSQETDTKPEEIVPNAIKQETKTNLDDMVIPVRTDDQVAMETTIEVLQITSEVSAQEAKLSDVNTGEQSKISSDLEQEQDSLSEARDDESIDKGSPVVEQAPAEPVPSPSPPSQLSQPDTTSLDSDSRAIPDADENSNNPEKTSENAAVDDQIQAVSEKIMVRAGLESINPTREDIFSSKETMDEALSERIMIGDKEAVETKPQQSTASWVILGIILAVFVCVLGYAAVKGSLDKKSEARVQADSNGSNEEPSKPELRVVRKPSPQDINGTEMKVLSRPLLKDNTEDKIAEYKDKVESDEGILKQVIVDGTQIPFIDDPSRKSTIFVDHVLELRNESDVKALKDPKAPQVDVSGADTETPALVRAKIFESSLEAGHAQQ